LEGHTTHALSIDNGRITEDHVTSALLVQFGNGCSDSLQSEDSTVGESSDGSLSQVLDNVGDGVGLGGEEVVNFL
jgi:archaeosine-15-forming tRNA-guanine transglycosylase